MAASDQARPARLAKWSRLSVSWSNVSRPPTGASEFQRQICPRHTARRTAHPPGCVVHSPTPPPAPRPQPRSPQLPHPPLCPSQLPPNFSIAPALPVPRPPPYPLAPTPFYTRRPPPQTFLLHQPRQRTPHLRPPLQQIIELLITPRNRRRIPADLLLYPPPLILQPRPRRPQLRLPPRLHLPT